MRDGYEAEEFADGGAGQEDAAEAQERTFAALPPAPGRGFAASWWGKAWLKALEDSALELRQLKAGRRVAREGGVGAVSVRPGRITAVVRERNGSTYRSDVLLQELDEQEWDRFLEMATERTGHIAALLDREMPPHLVEDAAAAGMDLLPGIGDLEPRCTCEAWDHCPHTAALCYQVARLLDQDPFVLLLMRGRGERMLLDGLQERIATAAGAPDVTAEAAEPAPDPGAAGIPAEQAYAAGSILPGLPAPPELPGEPGPAPSLDTETEPEAGVDPTALEMLARDAAGRARRMLADALAPGHEGRPVPDGLTVRQDAVRLAAEARPEPWIVHRLANGAGKTRAGLPAAVAAWRYGGATALAVLDEDRPLDGEALARARTRLAEAWEEDEAPRLRAERNCWTSADGGLQLRYGPDGRWYPYRKENGQWFPAGPSDDDPSAAWAEAQGA